MPVFALLLLITASLALAGVGIAGIGVFVTYVQDFFTAADKRAFLVFLGIIAVSSFYCVASAVNTWPTRRRRAWSAWMRWPVFGLACLALFDSLETLLLPPIAPQIAWWFAGAVVLEVLASRLHRKYYAR